MCRDNLVKAEKLHDDLADFSSWSSPQLALLCNIHTELLTGVDCKEGTPPLSQSSAGASSTGPVASVNGLTASGAPGGNASTAQATHAPRPAGAQQDGWLQRQDEGTLFSPQLISLHEAYHAREEEQGGITIPTHCAAHLPLEILPGPPTDFADSRRADPFRLRKPQRITATSDDSVLRCEMGGLEHTEENVPKRTLWYKSVAWPGVI